MQHSFEVEDAVKYGIEKAIILNNLRFWLEKNRANRKNISDGQVWTYNSADAFGVLFPYIKPKTIARYLREMEDDGLIISSQKSENKLDRTKFYTLPEYSVLPSSENEQAIVLKCAMEDPKMRNVTDINKQILNTDIKDKDLAPSVKNAQSPVEFIGSGFFLVLKDGKQFEPSVNQVRCWCAAYKTINVNSEIAAMVEWCKANPSKRKTKSGILRFCNAWLSRADKQPKRQDWDAAATDTTWADDIGECF